MQKTLSHCSLSIQDTEEDVLHRIQINDHPRSVLAASQCNKYRYGSCVWYDSVMRCKIQRWVIERTYSVHYICPQCLFYKLVSTYRVTYSVSPMCLPNTMHQTTCPKKNVSQKLNDVLWFEFGCYVHNIFLLRDGRGTRVPCPKTHHAMRKRWRMRNQKYAAHDRFVSSRFTHKYSQILQKVRSIQNPLWCHP